MAEVCEHTGLAVEGCGHCRGLDSLAPRREIHGEALPARFEGRCLGQCEGPIRIGDRVVRAADWGYRHEEC